MKKIFLFLAIGFIATTGFTQSKKTLEMLQTIEGQWIIDEQGLLTYKQVIEVPGASDSLLFQRANNFIKTNQSSNLLKEIYPEIYSISIQDTLNKVSSSFSSAVSAIFTLKIESKNSKARITLTVIRLSVNFGGGNINTYDIKTIYPINTGSLTKNDHAKWFYSTHMASLKKMDDISNYIKGPKTDGANW